MASRQNDTGERHRTGADPRPRRRRSARARRKRRLRALILLAMFLLALLLVGLAIWGLVSLFGGNKGDGGPASTASQPAVAVGSSSAPASAAQAQSPYADSPYYEADPPPLYNRDNFIPDDYSPRLASVGTGNGREQFMEARAAAAYLDMVAAAAAEGISMTPHSGHRSHEHQQNNYDAAIQSYMSQGYSREKAEELTRQYYSIPGTSEHEAGLAIDIDSIEQSFENTPAFAWLQQNAAGYGFILRYGKDASHITHVNYEPWHYRYVGVNHAVEIVRLGLTLEEYVATLG